MQVISRLGAAFGRLLLVMGACGVLDSAQAAPPDSRPEGNGFVVSYLVGTGDPFTLWQPDLPLDPSPYDWRIYDPVTRRDFSFLRLAGEPSQIRWDRSYRFVEYKVGRDVFRALWGPNSKPVLAVRLPVDSTVCDFWQDEHDSSWHFSSSRYLGELRRPGGGRFRISSAEIWESMEGGARWSLVSRDSCWEVSCACLKGWPSGMRSDSPVSLLALIEAMRFAHNPDRVPMAGSDGTLNLDEEHGAMVPVEGIRGTRIEFKETAEEIHAKSPMVYVNPSRGVRRTIYKEDPMLDEISGQMGFQQEGPYLLVAGEYIGTKARVVDLQTGEILFRAPRDARWSVWTAWPK